MKANVATIVPIGFRTEDSASYNEGVMKLRVVLTENDAWRINKMQELIGEYPIIENIRISIDGEVQYLNGDDEVMEGWVSDVEQFAVCKTFFYYYAQNKYDSSDQLESAAMYLE